MLFSNELLDRVLSGAKVPVGYAVVGLEDIAWANAGKYHLVEQVHVEPCVEDRCAPELVVLHLTSQMMAMVNRPGA